MVDNHGNPRTISGYVLSVTLNKDKIDKDKLLTSLRVRPPFGTPLEFSELPPEA